MCPLCGRHKRWAPDVYTSCFLGDTDILGYGGERPQRWYPLASPVSKEDCSGPLTVCLIRSPSLRPQLWRYKHLLLKDWVPQSVASLLYPGGCRQLRTLSPFIMLLWDSWAYAPLATRARPSRGVPLLAASTIGVLDECTSFFLGDGSDLEWGRGRVQNWQPPLESISVGP